MLYCSPSHLGLPSVPSPCFWQSVAQAFAGPVVALLVLFAGYLITHNKLANWLVWLYWITPMSWAIRTLAHNEFDSGRYDFLITTPTAAGPVQIRAGDLYLNQYAFQTESGYKWGGIGYLVRSLSW